MYEKEEVEEAEMTWRVYVKYVYKSMTERDLVRNRGVRGSSVEQEAIGV